MIISNRLLHKYKNDPFHRSTDFSSRKRDSFSIVDEKKKDQKFQDILKNETESYNKLYAKYKQQIEKNYHLEQEIKKFSNMESSNSPLQNQYRNLLHSYQNLENEYNKQQQNNRFLDDRNQILESERQQLMSRNERLDSRNQQLESDCKQLESINQQLKKQNEQLESRNQRLESESQQLISRNERIDSRNQRLESESQQLKNIQEINQQLTTQLSDEKRRSALILKTVKESRIIELGKKVKNSNTERQKYLQEQIRLSKHNEEKVKIEKNKIQIKYNELDNDLKQFRMIEKLYALPNQECSSKLNSNNLVYKFSKEILNSFHKKIVDLPHEFGSLRVIEIQNLFYDTISEIASGCYGIVAKARVHWSSLEPQQLPLNITKIYEYIAFKMMVNTKTLKDNEADATEAQKRSFDKEYLFPISYPHWSIIRIFNFFRSSTITRLINNSVKYQEIKGLIANKTTFFTMELAAGHLDNFLITNPSSTDKEKLFICSQLFTSIEHLNSIKKAHLDIKPNNILYVKRAGISDFIFILADFGVSNDFIVHKKKHNRSVGAPLYEAPEYYYAGEEDVDVSKYDIWSTALVAHKIFTNNNPKQYDFDIDKKLEKLGSFALKKFFALVLDGFETRISASIASRICFLLGFGFPTTTGSTIDIFSINERNFSAICNDMKSISLEFCEKWLLDKQIELVEELKFFTNNDISVKTFLNLNFIINTTPQILLDTINTYFREKYVHSKLNLDPE